MASECCANCGAEAKVRKRDFSAQAWSFLVLWNEVSKKAVDQAICQSCYDELREVLIDRVDEIDAAIEQTTVPAAKKPARTARKARLVGACNSNRTTYVA